MSRALLLTALSCWMLAACSEDHDEYVGPSRPPVLDGTLRFQWSINGRRVAEDCDGVGALLFESLVLDEGFLIDGVSVPCEDFEVSVPLYSDDFRARSALTDVNGFPAVGRIIDNFFSIETDKVTTLELDFPSAALPMDPTMDAGITPQPEPPAAPDAGGTPEPPPAVDAGADAGSP